MVFAALMLTALANTSTASMPETLPAPELVVSNDLRVTDLPTSTRWVFDGDAGATASEPASTGTEAPRRLRLSSPRFNGQGTPTTMADWQGRYDAAKNRKTGGLHKIIYGVVLEGVGVVVAAASVSSCDTTYGDCSDGSSAGAAVGLGSVIAGAVTFWWGIFQYFDANGEVHSLEATRPKSAGPALSFGEHQAMILNLGKKSSVGYQVSW